jgi:sugar/nucleoside kinase (ribokinase family)
LDFDYTTLGHVTIDIFADGSRQPGGTAFYSALQAARLGRRARIVTRGRPSELKELLEPYLAELELTILAAPHTTTLQTSGSGAARRQRMMAWAGPLAQDIAVDSAILHLAPVARETPTRWHGHQAFVGLTPQGLVRRWSGAGGVISLLARPDEGSDDAQATGEPPPPGRGVAEALAGADGYDAIVVSDEERACCEELIAAATRGGAVAAITAGPRPTTILLPDGRALQSPVASIQETRTDLGAGDVFAAAFFVSLAEGSTPDQAAAFANAAATVRMQGAGADAIGRRTAIEERLRAGAGGGSPG